MNRILCATLIAAGLSSSLASAESKPVPKSAEPGLLGTYRIVSGERNGKPIPPERLHVVSVRISEQTITTLDKGEKEVYVATYTLKKDQKPWRISMTATVTPDKSKGMKSDGLIELDGDTVKLIYALPGGKAPAAGDRRAPSSFKTGENQQMFVMKRAPL